MICSGCKKDFDKSVMTNARNVKGEYPKASKNYYCKPCEEQEYQRKLLVDYLHKWFMYKGYYKYDNSPEDKIVVDKIMKLINSQIANLKKDGYTYLQIRLIVEFILDKENVEFTDGILGLVPYYYVRTSKYHNDLHRIATSKSYGYIPPNEEVEVNRHVHRPNRKAIRVSNMELM